MINKDKSILIYSTEKDTSTLEVIKWIKYYDKKYKIIQSLGDFNDLKIKLNSNYFQENVSSIWYRKLMSDMPKLNTKNIQLKQSCNDFLITELEYFYLGIEAMQKGIKCLGNGFGLMDLNKIEVLLKAKTFGIEIPNFLLTTNKTELMEFKNKYDKIITKPIYNASPILFDDNNIGYMYTKIVNNEIINKSSNIFFPSFFQECISKDYEIRVFYLDSQFFSSAIFTKNDENNLDYRDKNINKIRSISYKLPKVIEEKLDKLMRSLSLNTGSIDIIKCKSGKYYFLEINPCGVFEGVTNACNYNVNKNIAEWLIN